MQINVNPEILHTWQVIEGVLCGEYPNSKEASQEKISELYRNGVSVFVDLTHPDDALTVYTPYLAICDNNPLSYHSYPIPDGGTVGIDLYIALCYLLKLHLVSGGVIYLHCWGGIGRTATVTACLMRVLDPKMTVEKAFELIDNARKDTKKGHLPAPENDAQRALVRDFYEYLDSEGE